MADPSPPRKNYGLRLNPDLMKKIQHVAVDEERNTNEIIEEALGNYLKDRNRKKKG